MVVIEISYEPASHRHQRCPGPSGAPRAAQEDNPWAERQRRGGRDRGQRQRQHTRAACPSSAHTPRPARMAASATRSSTPSKSAPRGSPRSCSPLLRGLRTALQLTTITLLSTGALVTVLKNGLLQTPGGVQRLLGRPAALRDHRPERARRPGKEVVPGEYRQSSRRSYRWPAGPGHQGLNDVNPGRD